MRSLSGVQPSGKLHIGNYFGAIKQFLEFQEKYECFYFVANYHALTTQTDPNILRDLTYNVVLDYLALGLDPEKSKIFIQSQVPEVTELSWILSNVTPMGLLERAHSYKDKIAKGIAPNHGLFSYPVLMAADILIYSADIVPVGKDQKQHVEMTRDIAIKFNNTFGEILTIPEPYIVENLAVVPGIDGQKMSKSYNNTIEIFASEKEAKKKIMSIVTDSKGLEEPKDPDNCNIFALYKLFATESEQEEMRKKYLAGNYGYGHAKLELLDKYLQYFKPFKEKRAALEKDKGYVQQILKRCGEEARDCANDLMKKVRKAVGVDLPL